MTDTVHSPPQRRPLGAFWKVAITILVLLAAAVSLLPYAVQWLLGDWLRDQGVVNVQIDDIDINPFVGKFVIRAISFEDEQGLHRAGFTEVDLSWTDLSNNRIRLSQVELRDATLSIRRTEGNALLLGSIVLSAAQAVEDVEASEADAGWGFGIDELTLEDVAIDYRDPLISRQLTIDSMTLEDIASWQPDLVTTLDVRLSSGDARLSANGDMALFAEPFALDLQVAGERLDAVGLETLLEAAGVAGLSGLLHADFQISVDAPADSGTMISVDGGIDLEDWRISLSEQEIGIDDAGWSGKLDVGLFGDTNTLAAAGSLSAGGLQVDAQPLRLALGDVGWSGDVMAEAGEQGASLVLDGELELSDAGFEETLQSQLAALGALSWRGRVASASEEDWQVRPDGTLTAQALSAGIGERPDLVQLDSATTRVLSPQAGQIVALQGLDLQGLRFSERQASQAEQPAHVLSVSRFDLDELVLGDAGLVMGAARIHDLVVWLEMQADGNLALGLPAGDSPAAPAQSPEASAGAAADTLASSGPATEPLAVRIASLNTVGESSLTFIDRSVRPEAELELRELALSLGGIDSSNPNGDLPFQISALQGRYAQLEFSGVTRPFAEQTFLDGSGSVTDINMLRLDGYLRRGIGYHVESGTLSADLDVKLEDRMLDSSAALTIRKLVIDPLEDNEQDEFSTELGVPLGTALALLEDDTETIRLNVPLKGDLDNLSVGVGDAIRVVMQKGLVAGMQTAATTYFAPLWPALAATRLFSAASALRFQAVTFAPSSAELSAERRDYVANMAELLAKRPKVNLTLCGRTVAADVQAVAPEGESTLDEEQRAALTLLADERQLIIKDALIEQGIESARLVTCNPEFRPADEGEPRVVFGV